MIENADKVMEIMSGLESYSFKAMQVIATLLLIISFSAHAIADCVRAIRKSKPFLKCKIKPTNKV